ncbi:TSL-kinase interacting protein 1 [Corylus avellana]|uniref:TSL-kinase interacting protein 1 n=1 Tax=Corylus avellana TaxID=13451 RepID=UPI00286D5293|nr:TSL-kinase interacting protein 1 [Corylus avellana]XP_059433569.1 TSL-kinase interacting protein 1 [Corylus avellana]
MNTARQRNRKAVKAPSKCVADIDCTGKKKSTKRTGGQSYKSAGKAEEFLAEKDEQSPLSSIAEGRCPELPVKSRRVSEKTKRSPLLELYPGPRLLPSAKIKLQLFPIDEDTRMGLEKDGHYPYLELTLSAQKKISSVLRHLNSKWGSSSIALGEPMVCPYNILKNVSGCGRWTLNDNGISAGDVFEAVGSPDIFRLRYGWFSYSEPKTLGNLSSSTPPIDCLQSEGTRKGCNNNVEVTYSKGKQIEVTSEELKGINVSEITAAIVAEEVANGPVDLVDRELRMDAGPGQSSVLWADGLTNISIGGLLSEASIQGKFKNSVPITNGLTDISVGGLLSVASLQGKSNNCDPKSVGSTSGLHPSQLISDSFDAYIAAQTNCAQVPRFSTQDSRSSILDAEETCQAFPFQKFSSSEKDVLPWNASACSGGCSQDAGSNSFKFFKAAEINCQSGFSQDHAHQESETDLLLCSRTYNDESSLGLSGIKWTDSRGPFDLGLPTSQKLTNGDSINISRFVR